MSVGQFVKNIADKIFAYIPKCLCCGIEKGAEGYLCAKCREERDKLTAGETVVQSCRAYSLYVYNGVIKHIVQSYKYNDNKWLAEHMGKEMAGALSQKFVNADFICHVPLHKKRRESRGFDQSEELAKSISKTAGIPFVSALRRIKNTKTQTKLNESQRKQNIQGAFESLCAVGGNAILVDDILTTGATACECAKVLEKAGADNVYIMTFAKSAYEKRLKSKRLLERNAVRVL